MALDSIFVQVGMVLPQTPFVVLGSVDSLASCCWLIDYLDDSLFSLDLVQSILYLIFWVYLLYKCCHPNIPGLQLVLVGSPADLLVDE